jgi:nucleoside-diphosphate-sugar epimerase
LTVLDYANQPMRAVVDETASLETRFDQRGSYTRAKVLSERLVTDAIRWRGLQAVVVRPGQIIGPGYESVAPYGTIAMAGRWIAIGSGNLKVPLVHVDDVVDALIAAATRSHVCGLTFHLVDSTPITQRDYIARCKHRASYVPRSALMFLGGALEIVGKLLKRNLPLTRYRVRSIKELNFDCSAAQRHLGWAPRTGVSAERTSPGGQAWTWSKKPPTRTPFTNATRPTSH